MEREILGRSKLHLVPSLCGRCSASPMNWVSFIKWNATNTKWNNNPRWWFQIFFIFIPIWGRFPIWLIFLNGLKPPTRIPFLWKHPLKIDGWFPFKMVAVQSRHVNLGGGSNIFFHFHLATWSNLTSIFFRVETTNYIVLSLKLFGRILLEKLWKIYVECGMVLLGNVPMLSNMNPGSKSCNYYTPLSVSFWKMMVGQLRSFFWKVTVQGIWWTAGVYLECFLECSHVSYVFLLRSSVVGQDVPRKYLPAPINRNLVETTGKRLSWLRCAVPKAKAVWKMILESVSLG